MNTVAVINRHWLAELNLGFESDGRRTIIGNRKHVGPLVIQKPFYPEGKVCHVYILHPPAGIVGGDELRLNIDLLKNAQALVTTPAATKFYRGNGFVARQVQQINVDAGCEMEWLPQETIFFSGCDAQTTTRVNLEGDAKFIGWEMICLGRPASNEVFDQGLCRQHVEVWRDQKPLVIERSRLEGGDELLDSIWGMQGHVLTATLIATGANDEVLNAVRTYIEEFNLDEKNARLSATLINDVLICRLLAQQAEVAREIFISIWKVLRPYILLRPAVAPRIWYT